MPPVTFPTSRWKVSVAYQKSTDLLHIIFGNHERPEMTACTFDVAERARLLDAIGAVMPENAPPASPPAAGVAGELRTIADELDHWAECVKGIKQAKSVLRDYATALRKRAVRLDGAAADRGGGKE